MTTTTDFSASFVANVTAGNVVHAVRRAVASVDDSGVSPLLAST